MTHRYLKPARPFPFRAHPLWRGCVWATPVGYGRGFRASNGNLATVEDRFKGRGDIQASPDPGNFAVQDMGRVLANEGASKDKIVWTNTASRYDPGGDTMSAAVLFRTAEVNSGQGKAILSMAGVDDMFTTSYTFQILINDFGGNNDFYEFRLRIAGNKVITSAVTATTTQTDMLVATYDGSNMRLYVNGVQVASMAQTGTPTQSGFQVRIFGQTSNDSVRLSGYVGMAAIWNRVLSIRERRLLLQDPYLMWKSQFNPENQPEGLQQGAPGLTYFNAF